MGKKPTKREQAYTLWVQEVPITQISARLKVARGTVQRWKREDKWDELRESIPDPPKEEPARRPKLVSFEGRESRQQRRNDAPAFTLPDLSSLDGQLALIDHVIGLTVTEIANPQSPQTYSAALNFIAKGMSERRAICPIDRMELLLKLTDHFRDPADMLEYLKATGWGRKSA